MWQGMGACGRVWGHVEVGYISTNYFEIFLGVGYISTNYFEFFLGSRDHLDKLL